MKGRFVAILSVGALTLSACGRDPRAADVGPTTTDTTTSTATSTTSSAPPRSTTTSTAQGRLALPGYDPSGGVMDALLKGARITGDEAKGCVWIVRSDDTTIAAVWPIGTSASFAPIRIYDPSGALIWTEGETHDIGGGGSPVIDAVPPQCRTGDTAWWVSPMRR